MHYKMLQQVQKMQVYVLFPMTQISTEHQDSSESTTMNMDMQSVKMQQNGSTITLKRTKKLKLVSATTQIIHSW